MASEQPTMPEIVREAQAVALASPSGTLHLAAVELSQVVVRHDDRDTCG
jgi:hypothetical protein